MKIAGYDTDDAAGALDFEDAMRPESGDLTLDADGILYKACYDKKRLETAIRSAKTMIFEMQFLTQCANVRAHLTAAGGFKNGRKYLRSAKPYQGNRSGKAKPPLLEPLRLALAEEGTFEEHEGVEVFLHRDIEADDAMMIDSYSIPGIRLWSPDKDLQISPVPQYDDTTGKWRTLMPGDRFGWIDEAYTPAGDLKVIGHGTKFFWAQMLMGDTADNVAGLTRFDGKLCGGRGALDRLLPVQTEDEAADLVLRAYMRNKQNPLPEAGCLWLLRTREDTAEGYIASLNLHPTVRDQLTVWYNETWKDIPEGDYAADI